MFLLHAGQLIPQRAQFEILSSPILSAHDREKSSSDFMFDRFVTKL